MRLNILAGELLKNEFLQKNIPAEIKIDWSASLEELVTRPADAYFDLLFENEPARVAALARLLPSPVYINAVTDTLAEIGHSFIRINAWPGFLGRSVMEVVSNKAPGTAILDTLGWKFKVVPDQPGMIAPRVIAMIVNEAYFALGEDVSSKGEIDTAMKLGTNYPYGPFEWAEKIGLVNIGQLLRRLSKTDDRYAPANALLADAHLR